MNLIHRVYCRSALWRRHLGAILPWATDGVPLDGRVLELGSGPGLTTEWLRPRVGSLTAVEYDKVDATALSEHAPDVDVHHADATDLPFDDGSFDAVLCFTMLHHVPSVDLQDRLFTEARRVLKPTGVFAGSDSRWGPLFAVAHLGDNLQLVDPDELPERLTGAGFSQPEVWARRGVFRFRAVISGG
jgi:SAM-dependent methyltransferase